MCQAWGAMVNENRLVSASKDWAITGGTNSGYKVQTERLSPWPAHMETRSSCPSLSPPLPQDEDSMGFQSCSVTPSPIL